MATFPFACKCQLRGETIAKDESQYLLRKGLINETQLQAVSSRRGWEPYYFLGAMREAINNGLEKSRMASQHNYSYRGSTTESQLLMFDESLKNLALAIGGLLRVKNTGLPIAYDQLFGIIFNIFFVIATLAWSPSLGWYVLLCFISCVFWYSDNNTKAHTIIFPLHRYTPILVGVLKFTVRLIIVIGSQLEDPFGTDVRDRYASPICRVVHFITHQNIINDIW